MRQAEEEVRRLHLHPRPNHPGDAGDADDAGDARRLAAPAHIHTGTPDPGHRGRTGGRRLKGRRRRGERGGCSHHSSSSPRFPRPSAGRGPRRFLFALSFRYFLFTAIKWGPSQPSPQRRPCRSCGREDPAAKKPWARSQGYPWDERVRAAVARGGGGPRTVARGSCPERAHSQTRGGRRPGGARIHPAPCVPREEG